MPFLATAAFWIAVGKAILIAAIEYGLSQLLAPNQNANRNQDNQLRGRDINARGTVEYRQIIYGEVQTGGYIAWIGVGDVDTNILIYVVVVAAHQCEAISDCWLDDRKVPNADIDGSTGAVSTAAFKDKGGVSRLTILRHLGTHNQAVDANLTSAVKQWDAGHVGSGLAYVVHMLTYSDDVWSNGGPNAFMHLVKGKRVYDPRLDSTNGGSGSHRYNDATTWAWSNNAELCNRDYITGGSVYFSTATPVNILGVGESNSRIEDSYAIAAANVCDQACNIPLALTLTPALSATGSGLTRAITKAATATAGWVDTAYASQPMQSIDLTIAFASTTKNVLAGLAKFPTNGLDYTMVSFAWTYSTADAALAIYENGVKIGTFGTYTVGTTTLHVTYDGANVRYYKNGALQRTTACTGNLYVMAAFNEVSSAVTLTLAACTQSRYTCDTQLSCGDTHAANMNILLSSMLGHLSYVNGKYRMFAGAYDSPSVTLNADDVQGPMEISTHPVGEELFNYVTGTFWDEDRNWKLNTYPAQTQSTYQTDDGGLFPHTIDLHATRTNVRCQRMANVMLQQSRNKITINCSMLSPKAVNIAQWDTFLFTLPEYGYVAQVFRCLEWKFLQSGFIEITAQIESASAYNDLAITDYIDPASNIPPSTQVQLPQVPTGLVLTSFPTYINAEVQLTNQLRKGEIVEIWEHTSSSPFSSATKIAEGAKTVFQIARRDTTTRYYWSRVRLNGQYSATYPASTGSSAVADLAQTTDIASGAITESYSTNDSTGAALITFTPAASGTLSVDALVEAASTFDKDSGTYFAIFLDPSSDYSGGPGGSAVYDGYVGWQSGLVRCTSSTTGLFSVTGGVSYKIGIKTFKSFGSLTIYNFIMQAVVKKK